MLKFGYESPVSKFLRNAAIFPRNNGHFFVCPPMCLYRREYFGIHFDPRFLTIIIQLTFITDMYTDMYGTKFLEI